MSERTFYPWPSIENFARFVEDNPMWMYQPGGWYRMVKLHGTNAAVVVTRDGDVYAQSRNRIITPENDNCGFAAWVESQRAEWAAPIRRGRVFFGEWVGPGIQNGVAACQIPRRKFCVFSVFYPGDGSRSAPRGPDLHGLADTLRIPRQLVDAPDLTAEAIDAAVAACEECDPFIEHHFGIRGTGEGYVYYTFLDDQPGFKAKGAAHRVAKSRTPTTPPENASDVATFVSTYVTDARLEQIAFAVTQRQIPYPKETTGEFLKAFSADVMKEADLGTLTWKEVGKAVNTAAAAWYRARSL